MAICGCHTSEKRRSLGDGDQAPPHPTCSRARASGALALFRTFACSL